VLNKRERLAHLLAFSDSFSPLLVAVVSCVQLDFPHGILQRFQRDVRVAELFRESVGWSSEDFAVVRSSDFHFLLVV
jgi:hypothetical protein